MFSLQVIKHWTVLLWFAPESNYRDSSTLKMLGFWKLFHWTKLFFVSTTTVENSSAEFSTMAAKSKSTDWSLDTTITVILKKTCYNEFKFFYCFFFFFKVRPKKYQYYSVNVRYIGSLKSGLKACLHREMREHFVWTLLTSLIAFSYSFCFELQATLLSNVRTHQIPAGQLYVLKNWTN